MKRSHAITLGLMGAGLAVFAWPFWEEDTVAAAAYESVDQCVADGRARDACKNALSEASAEHQRSAPRYTKREDCEAEFGVNACRELPASNGGGSAAAFFAPAMTGFLLANALGSGYAAQPLYRPCAEVPSNDPRCRNSSFSGGGGGGASRSFFTARAAAFGGGHA